MKLLLLTGSYLLPSLLDVFKSEVKALKKKLSIINLEKSFWENPQTYLQSEVDNDIWLLVDSKKINLVEFKALLALTKFKGVRLVFLESGMHIFSLLSKISPEFAQIKFNEVGSDLNLMAASLEQSVLSEAFNFKSYFNNLSDLNFKEGKISSIIFEGHLQKNPTILTGLKNHWFAKLRFNQLKLNKDQLLSQTVYRLSPRLKIVSSSSWLDSFFNQYWPLICSQESSLSDVSYKTSNQAVQPILSSTFKSYFMQDADYHQLSSLFDKLIDIEDQISEHLTDKKLKDDFLVSRYQALSPLEQFSLFEKNLTKINNQNKLRLLSTREEQIKKTQQVAIEDLKKILASAQNYDEVDLSSIKTNNVMAISYDKDMFSQISQAKITKQKILWFDVSRINNLDSLTEININKYKNFAKNSLVLIPKTCAGKLGRLILKLEYHLDENIDVKPAKNDVYEKLILSQNSLSQAIFNFWQPILFKLAQRCLIDEARLFVPKLTKKIILDKKNYFKQAFKGPVLQISLDKSFITLAEDEQIFGISNQNNYYVIQSENKISEEWQKVKNMLDKQSYKMVVCQLNVDHEANAYQTLQNTQAANIVFWQDKLPVDAKLAKYDQQNWEFLYYLDNKSKSQQLKALLS